MLGNTGMSLPVNLPALRGYEDGARYLKAEEIFGVCSVCPFVCLALKKKTQTL